MTDTPKPATMREAWAKAMEGLRPGYPAAYADYLSRLQPVSYQAGVLTVAAPNEHVRDMCALRLARLVRQEMAYTAGREVDVRYVLATETTGGASC